MQRSDRKQRDCGRPSRLGSSILLHHAFYSACLAQSSCRMYARGRRLKPMTPQDQWYYLDGSETRGPVPSSQIVQLIRAGSLSPASQVAQAGWPQWSPASTALAHLLGAQPAPGPTPVAQGEPPTYAIKIHCVSGPDAGKAYMVGASEVSLGRVSGIGQTDPQVAENHVVLSWQNNVLHFRTFGGARLRVAGVDVTQGALSNGQQFQMGASIWQVGAAPVELTNLLGLACFAAEQTHQHGKAGRVQPHLHVFRSLQRPQARRDRRLLRGGHHQNDAAASTKCRPDGPSRGSSCAS